MIYLTLAAQAGSTDAQLALGYRYAAGIGVSRNCPQSRNYYYLPAKKGIPFISHLSSILVVAAHYVANKNYQIPKTLLLTDIRGSVSSQQEILDYYEYSADLDELHTLIVLGQIFYEGYNGTPTNYAQARHYFEQAAERGSAAAKGYLGDMYYYGHGVPKDTAKAFRYYREGAVEGSSIAKNGLGVLYREGIEVVKDEDEALKLFLQASEDGLAEAQYNAGLLMHKLFPLTMDDKSLSMLVKAFQQGKSEMTERFNHLLGHTLAHFEIARQNVKNNLVCTFSLAMLRGVVEKGPEAELFQAAFDDYHGGDKEVSLAKYFYLADHGFEVAQYNAAQILLESKTPHGYRRAMVYLHRSASQGNVKARLKLGDIFFYGHGLSSPNMVNAYLAYKEAYTKNSAQASFNLGYMYQHGLGVPVDYHLAVRYYEAAASIDRRKYPQAWLPVRLALIGLELLQAKNRIKRAKMFVPYVATALIGLLSLQLLLRRYFPLQRPPRS